MCCYTKVSMRIYLYQSMNRKHIPTRSLPPDSRSSIGHASDSRPLSSDKEHKARTKYIHGIYSRFVNQRGPGRQRVSPRAHASHIVTIHRYCKRRTFKRNVIEYPFCTWQTGYPVEPESNRLWVFYLAEHTRLVSYQPAVFGSSHPGYHKSCKIYEQKCEIS